MAVVSRFLAVKGLAITRMMPTVKSGVLAGWDMAVAMVILETILRSRAEWAMVVVE